MNILIFLVAVSTVAIVITGMASFFLKRRDRGVKDDIVDRQQRSDLNKIASAQVLTLAVENTSKPRAILIGDNPLRPAIKITPLDDEVRFDQAHPLKLQGSLPGRVASALQAVPSLLAACAKWQANHGGCYRR